MFHVKWFVLNALFHWFYILIYCFDYTTKIFLISIMFWENIEWNDFHWILPFVNMSISRGYIRRTFHIWILAPNIIFFTSVLVMFSKFSAPIIMTLWWNGNYDIDYDCHISLHICLYSPLLDYSLLSFDNIDIICLVVIIIRTFILLFTVTNVHVSIIYYNKFMVSILCWTTILLILLRLCDLYRSSFTSNIYSLVFIDIMK